MVTVAIVCGLLTLFALAFILGMAVGQGAIDKHSHDQIHELRFQLQQAQHQCRRLQHSNDALSDSTRELVLRNTELERTATTYARQGLAVSLELQRATSRPPRLSAVS